MKKRILSLLLALVLTMGLIPATAVSAAADDIVYSGVGYSHVNGGDLGYSHVNGAATDTSVDYCKILGITQATADKFSETVRASLRQYDLDVDVSSLGIYVDNSQKELNAFFAMMEHEVFFQYDTFMFDATTYTYNRNSNRKLTSIVFHKEDLVYKDVNEYQSSLTMVELVAEHLMDGIKGNGSLTHLQKALLCHDRLAAWTSYDYDNQKAKTCPPESYTAYGILCKQVGVCQGYAEVYAYMMDQLGIPNRFAQSSQMNHIWNIVTIGGREYYVDVTWDDPAQYDLFGQVKHNHFLISPSKLKQSHANSGYTNITDYSKITEDTAYDNWFWTESHAEFQLIGDSGIYYLDNFIEEDPRYAAICQWAGNNLYTLLKLNDTDAMKWMWNNGGYWTDRNFACLDSYNGKLYANAADRVYEYDPSANTWSVVFQAQLNGYQRIYGFTMYHHRMWFNFMDNWSASFKAHENTKKYYDSKTVTSIKVAKTPKKTAYYVGDIYDWTGIALEVTYSDGSKDTVKNYVSSWNGYNTALVGDRTFTIKYYDATTTFDVKVIKPLSTPKVTAKNDDNGVVVSWGKVSNAKEYVVYRSYKSGSSWSDWSRMTGTTKTSYTDKSAKAGKIYRYMVRAYHADLASGYGKSSEIRRLTSPTVKVANSAGGAYVSWKKVTGATKYQVYRSYYKSGKWTDWVKVKETTSLTYTDTKAANNTRYRYTVKAINGSQKSAGGTSDAIRRLKPVTTTAKKSGSTIKLSWASVSGAKKYVVYRRKAGASTWTKMTTTTSRSYTDKSAKKGTYYEYSVRAVNGSDYSAHKACKKVKR